MLTGLFTSANAMGAFQTSMDNTSNNLANVNTTAFKRSAIDFQDLGYFGEQGNQVGTGTKIASISPRGFASRAI